MTETSNTISIEQFMDISKQIEEMVWEYDISYMDAALMLAEKLNVEVENIGAMIQQNQNLTAKIQEEAEALHYVAKEHRLEI